MQGVAVAGNREVLIDVVASAVVCFVERIELARVAAQLIQVGVEIERVIERQPALDAALDGRGLVVREVDAVVVAAAAGPRPRSASEQVARLP